MPDASPGDGPRSDDTGGSHTVLLARRLKQVVTHLVLMVAACSGAYVGLSSAVVVAYRWIDPPITAIQAQRRLEAVLEGVPYQRTYHPRPASVISDNVLHAVVAAEDNRFFQHRGFDWDAIETAINEGRGRGASTISQQLTKNLFLTTHRSYLRKAVEAPMTLLIEVVLSKDRILELYVNVIEWADGVYGIEAAMQHHFGGSADRVSRRQAAALASCLPDPRRRRPRMNGWYTNIIIRRMNQMGY